MGRLGPYLLGPNDTPENGIYTGDAKTLAKAIPDNSIDLIFTDPVYQNIDDYEWLSKTAQRVLKPTGHLLTYVTQEHLPQQLAALGHDLAWGWIFHIQVFGRRAAIWKKKVQACGQLIAWHTPGQFKHPGWASDFMGVTMGRFGSGHKWQKGIKESLEFIEAFADPHQVVVDFFCGSGTIPVSCVLLDCYHLGFEMDPDVAKQARRQIHEVVNPFFRFEQAPLF